MWEQLLEMWVQLLENVGTTPGDAGTTPGDFQHYKVEISAFLLYYLCRPADCTVQYVTIQIILGTVYKVLLTCYYFKDRVTNLLFLAYVKEGINRCLVFKNMNFPQKFFHLCRASPIGNAHLLFIAAMCAWR